MPRRITPQELHALYEDGLPGWQFNRDTMDELLAESDKPMFGDAAPNLRGSGKGKRALLWRSRELFDPGAFGKESQTTGDCVSHGSRNARDTSRAVEIHIKGEAESYYKRGATEPTYGSRNHSGQGMDPATAARFERDNGFLVRQDYGFVDLSQYDSDIGADWGRRGVPDKVKAECKKHPVGSFTMPDSVEDAMDLMFNGYAGHSGQNIGFRSRSDRRGIFQTSGGWNHDMGIVGYDDTKEVYPVAVVFIPNSWGDWNEKPENWNEEVYGPWIIGMIVISMDVFARFVRAESMFFYSNITGFPAQKLPDHGATGVI